MIQPEAQNCKRSSVPISFDAFRENQIAKSTKTYLRLRTNGCCASITQFFEPNPVSSGNNRLNMIFVPVLPKLKKKFQSIKSQF